MKKILLFSFLSLLVISSCRKKEGAVSTTVTASFPTITFVNAKYFSIKVGDLRPTVIATAYDSFYKESVEVVIIDSTINNLVAGLYTGTATAKNHYGFVKTVPYYVAVTDISDSMDLSGFWFQPGVDPSNPDSTGTNIQKLARGLYYTSNVAGANKYLDPADVSADIFAVLDNSTIVFMDNSATLDLTPGDTTISYTGALGPVVFQKK